MSLDAVPRKDAPKHEHNWRFDGDDPYIVCECGERWDAITGLVITKGRFFESEEES